MLAFTRYKPAVAKFAAYNPGQKRAPKGVSTGGQWVDEDPGSMGGQLGSHKGYPFTDQTWSGTTEFDKLPGIQDSNAAFRKIVGVSDERAYVTPTNDQPNTDKTDAARLKAANAKRIGAVLDAKHDAADLHDVASLYGVPHLYDKTLTPGEKVADGLMLKWAQTSGDSDPYAALIQYAVAEEFGLDAAATKHLLGRKALENRLVKDGLGSVMDIVTNPDAVEPKDKVTFTRRQLDRTKIDAVLRTAARAQYDETQRVLSAAGVDSLTLVRGVSLRPEELQTIGRDGVAQLQPASSFTASPYVAQRFAYGTNKGKKLPAIIRVKVPRSRVFSLPSTGFGCLSESEVLLLGGTIRTRVVGQGVGNDAFSTRGAADWDESKHPRVPAGNDHGGEFANADASGTEFPYADEETYQPKADSESRISNQLFEQLHALDVTEDPEERGELAAINKKRVNRALGDALDKEFTAEQLNAVANLIGTYQGDPGYVVSAAFVDGWAASSGDTNPMAILYQHAANEAAGVDGAFEHLNLETGAFATKGDTPLDRALNAVKGDLGLYGDAHPITANDIYSMMQVHARAQYTATQKMLSAPGMPKDFVLWRGVSIDPKDGVSIAKTGLVSLQPLSSFSSSRDTALDFATQIQGDYESHDAPPIAGFESQTLTRAHLLRTRIPRERIFSLPRTGFGCLEESEWVVLGNKNTRTRISKRWGKFSDKRKETRPDDLADPRFTPFSAREAEFNESLHPRVPAGHPGGGQWTDGGSEYLEAIGPQSEEFPYEDRKYYDHPDSEGQMDGETELSDLHDGIVDELGDALGLDTSVSASQKTKRQVEQLLGAHLEQQFSSDELEEMCTLLGIPTQKVGDNGKERETHQRMAQNVAGRLTQQWAVSSGDTHPWSVLIQDAIRQEFGLEDAAVDHLGDSVEDVWKSKLFSDAGIEAGGDGAFSEHERSLTMRVLRAHVRAQYVETQLALKKADIYSLDLVRGASLDRESTFDIARTGSVVLQPASSFSLSWHTARSFSGQRYGADQVSTVIRARIPRNRILSFPRTGFGCLNESEIVVLGGRLNKTRIMYWL